MSKGSSDIVNDILALGAELAQATTDEAKAAIQKRVDDLKAAYDASKVGVRINEERKADMGAHSASAAVDKALQLGATVASIRSLADAAASDGLLPETGRPSMPTSDHRRVFGPNIEDNEDSGDEVRDLIPRGRSIGRTIDAIRKAEEADDLAGALRMVDIVIPRKEKTFATYVTQVAPHRSWTAYARQYSLDHKARLNENLNLFYMLDALERGNFEMVQELATRRIMANEHLCWGDHLIGNYLLSITDNSNVRNAELKSALSKAAKQASAGKKWMDDGNRNRRNRGGRNGRGRGGRGRGNTQKEGEEGDTQKTKNGGRGGPRPSGGQSTAN